MLSIKECLVFITVNDAIVRYIRFCDLKALCLYLAIFWICRLHTAMERGRNLICKFWEEIKQMINTDVRQIPIDSNKTEQDIFVCVLCVCKLLLYMLTYVYDFIREK